ncbi:hypothetical protein JMJ35_005251 [Cladonia borealis]|uniref:Uncharacterized protein n=1 Tax=Cladonia borealis TaxID=184061 RepID=A0AA39R2G1_9LECA|nr:hypothetical protein JMJ35_005251 [Cladonia borealis]
MASLPRTAAIRTTHGPQDARSVTEMLFTAFLMTAGTTIAALYLTSLRRQPRKLASYQVLASILIPTFPFAELLISIYRTLNTTRQQGLVYPTRYYLCAALDQRAIPETEIIPQLKQEDASETNPTGLKAVKDLDGDSVPLHHIPYDSLQCEWDLFDASWFARLAMLLMFCGHTSLPILFWIRRLQQPNARTFLDDFTVAMALSGLLIAFTSIAIMVLNTTWRAPGRYAEKFKKHCNEPTTIDLFLNLVHRAKLVEMKMSLFLCVCLQSIAFFTWPTAPPGWTFLKTNAWCLHTISPDVSQERDDLDSLMINAGVKWSKLPPRTCPSLGLSSIMVPLASCGYIIAFVAAMTPLAILLSFLLKWLLRLVRRNEGGMLSKWEEIPRSLFELLSISYLFLSYGLSTIALFDIITSRKREPWMWRDPWADKRLYDLVSMWH